MTCKHSLSDLSLITGRCKACHRWYMKRARHGEPRQTLYMLNIDLFRSKVPRLGAMRTLELCGYSSDCWHSIRTKSHRKDERMQILADRLHVPHNELWHSFTPPRVKRTKYIKEIK